MTTTEYLVALLVLGVVSVLSGVAVATLQDRWRRRRLRRRERSARPSTTANETQYSAFAEGAHPGSLDIDPLQEAEIYLAYGNKATAREVLEKAVQAMPERADIRDKLEELRAE